jgi:hypothetical protein
MELDIPTHIKHYDFKKVIVQSILGDLDYDNFIEYCRVSDLHSKLLNKYNLNNHINWYF